MFDMSWGEVMVIGGVALIVIGPKDLPKALRTVGQMTTKVRRLASEFQSQFNEAMREAELEDVRKDLEGLNRSVASATTGAFNPIQTIRDELKGAIDAKPLPEPVVYTPHPETPMPEAPLVEEIGPMHHLEPVPAVPPPALEAPLSAASAMSEPAGPGLEGTMSPAAPSEPLKSATA